MKKNRSIWVFPVKQAVILVLLSVAGYAAMVYLYRSVKNLEFFSIKEIITKESNRGDFSYLLGRNIFNVDLKKEAGFISKTYPVYQKVRLIRILPNQLFLDFLKRKPAALVKLYKYFYVDRELTLWQADSDAEESGLPVITGLDTKIFGPKQGQSYNLPSLALALDFLQELRKNNVLRNYPVKKIDAHNSEYISCFIPVRAMSSSSGVQAGQEYEEVEVRVNSQELKEKLQILSGLITQLKSGLATIKYIDLRFKEPVIKLKDVS